MNRVCTPGNLSTGWQSLTAQSGLTVAWLRTLDDLKVKISGRVSASIATSAVVATLPAGAMSGIASATYITVQRFTALVGSDSATRLMILETDGRIRNTTGLTLSAGNYVFADHTVIYTK